MVQSPPLAFFLIQAAIARTSRRLWQGSSPCAILAMNGCPCQPLVPPKHHTAQVPISDLFIHLKDGTTKAIEGSVLPHITNPVLRPAVAHPDITTLQQLQHDNQLADAINAEDERLKIDILIGSDYLWDFVQGHVQPLPSGLNLLPTSLGYVVTGKTDTSPTTALPATTLIAAAADVSHEEVLPLLKAVHSGFVEPRNALDRAPVSRERR